MKKEESKIIKLQKKHKRLYLLESCWLSTSIIALFLSGLTAGLAHVFQIFPLFIVGCSLFSVSLSVALLTDVVIPKLWKKSEKIEKEIEYLKNFDKKEKQIYTEYVKLQELKNDKTQKKQRNNFISILIKRRRKNEIQAEQEPVIEVEQEITK